MAISPNGKWVASGNQDSSVHVWRLWSGDDFQMTGYPAKVETISWDFYSRLLAVGNVGDVTVWDFSGKGPQGTEPRALDGFQRRVTLVAFQHRSALLAAGSADGLLAFWEPLRSKHARDTVAFDAEISALSWSPDDSAILVGCAAGHVALLPAG
jgi:WD40 repeat protein